MAGPEVVAVRSTAIREPMPTAGVARILVLIAMGVAGIACNRPGAGPATTRPAPESAATRYYTLESETRPALGSPTESSLVIRTAVRTEPQLLVGLPEDFPEETPAIVSGTLRHADRAAAVTPFVVRPVSGKGHDGFVIDRRRLLEAMPQADDADLTLTALAAAPNRPLVLSETAIPQHARLEFAYGLAPAAALTRDRSVRLTVTALEQGQPPTRVWTTEVSTGDDASYRWREASAALTDLAGRRVRLELDATVVGAERAPTFVVWQQPQVVVGADEFPRTSIIMISVDTLRADRIGVYGSYRPTTPSIDRRSADAALFTNAWSTWPETSGAHMSMFTSRYPSEHGVRGFIYRPPDDMRLVTERLAAAGYATRAFTEDGGVWARAGFARGFDAYSERRSADFVYRGEARATFEDAGRWLEQAKDRDFFLFVHTYEVHAPYEPSGGYAAMFSQIPPREPAPFAGAALAYDRETRFVDDVVDRFLARIGALGLQDRVVVILTSDHGEEFGEHGGLGHGRSVYQEVLHVPLIVWAPGRLAPGRYDTPASILDLAPTILELAGLPPDPDHRGASLLTPAGHSSERALFGEVDREDGGPRKAVTVRWKRRSAIRDLATDQLRCYDADDPAQQQPHEDCPDLDRLIQEHRSSAAEGASRAMDVSPEVERKMRALGYLD